MLPFQRTQPRVTAVAAAAQPRDVLRFTLAQGASGGRPAALFGRADGRGGAAGAPRPAEDSGGLGRIAPMFS